MAELKDRTAGIRTKPKPQLKDQIATIAGDLMNLEVNTIIKGNITGRKMPSPGHALIDIAKCYDVKLAALGYPVQDSNFKPGSFNSFDTLREQAKKGIIELEAKAVRTEGLSGKEEADLMMLWRIKAMSDQIKGIYNALERRPDSFGKDDFGRDEIEQTHLPLDLTSDELVKIRKIWEMGTQEVALQTVIQMDGDIITTIKKGYEGKTHTGLHNLHNQGVSTCLNFWRELIGIVKDLLESLLKLVFKMG